jgi:putative hydrolase of the HAD superfamily
VGVSKPDPAIYSLALGALGLRPDEVAMLGDSLPADIAPARQAGLTTVWIRGDRVFGPADERAADFVAAGLAEALGLCEGM